MEWKQKIIDNFDSRADKYDSHSYVQNKAAQALARELPDLGGKDNNDISILEIGCGTGSLTYRLLDHYSNMNADFYITDISPQMLAAARRNISKQAKDLANNIKWLVMDGENPSIAAENEYKFDVIASNMAFQWFGNAQESITKLSALLKPGGSLVYSVPANDCFREWKEVLNKLSLPVGMLDFKELAGEFKKEVIEVDYENSFSFLKSIKNAGTNTPRAGYNVMGYEDIKRACELYDQYHGGKFIWRISYGRICK